MSYSTRTEQDWLAWANENLPPERVKQYRELAKWARLLASQNKWIALGPRKATG